MPRKSKAPALDRVAYTGIIGDEQPFTKAHAHLVAISLYNRLRHQPVGTRALLKRGRKTLAEYRRGAERVEIVHSHFFPNF